MKGQEALPEHLTDDALRDRSTTNGDRRNHIARKVVSSGSCDVGYSNASLVMANKTSPKRYWPMHLVPADPVPRTALRAKLRREAQDGHMICPL